MDSSKLYMLISIAIYLAFMLYIGYACSKKNDTVGDFYLGGRSLGPVVTAMSAEASDMSSWLLLGVPGLAYLTGLYNPVWTALGLIIGTYLNWLLVAKKLRTYSHQLKAITLPEYLGKRFHDKKYHLDLISAAIIIIFFIPYTASGFAACGKLFSTLFDMNYQLAMIISALVIVGYTALGGFLAASITDLVQSIIMTFAIIFILVFGIYMAGGFEQVMNNANSLTGYLSLSQIHIAGGGSKPGSIIGIISTLAWGLGYFGMPHILLRFMAIKDKQKLSMSRRIATIWVIISLAVAVVIGIVGRAITAKGIIPMLEGSHSETILIRIATLMGNHGVIMALLAGLILAGILASTMSTADSQLLAASSSLSHNILNGFCKKEMTQKQSMLAARSTVIGITILGIILALDPNSSVFEIVSFAWAGFGATFAPVILCSLFWKNANKAGAMSGMIVGAITIFIWKYIVRPLGGGWDIYELLPAFILSLVTIIIVSLATNGAGKEIHDEFEEYEKMIHEEDKLHPVKAK